MTCSSGSAASSASASGSPAATWMREVFTASVWKSSVLSLLCASISSSERKILGIQRMALVSRMERQNTAVMVGDGPFSMTHTTPSRTISASISVQRTKKPNRPKTRPTAPPAAGFFRLVSFLIL